MKRFYILICLAVFWISANAQSYDVLNYNFNGTPVHGINIKTNLPFVNYSQMVALKIEGYSYGHAAVISLNLVWYVYDNSFYNYSMSSSGGYAPEISLSNNNGFVNIFINDKPYFQRFKITAFAQGMSEQASWFSAWSVVDEPVQGTHAVMLPYQNSFKGIANYGDLYSLGNVGIGTTDPKGYKLAVNGKIRAQEIKVETANWPDYVFARDYQLPTLLETEKHIKDKGHLPGIPSATEVKANGVDLGEMNAKLLQKIEELTLHLIEQSKIITIQEKTNSVLNEKVRAQEIRLSNLESKQELIHKNQKSN